MTKGNEDTGESKVVIGELTSVRIGLIIMILGAVISATWWASSVNSKLDSILTLQASTTAKITQLETDVSELKLKIAMDDVSIKSLQDRNIPTTSK